MLLYHYPLCAKCRKIRLALGEKHLEHELVVEKPWEYREEFLELNPAGRVPVLIDKQKYKIIGNYPITEYIEERYTSVALLPKDGYLRAEVRRLSDWFDEIFSEEVTQNLVYEKTIKRFVEKTGPDSSRIRLGAKLIHEHLDYIGWLLSKRHWLAGDELSYADLAGAAHLSCIDYLGQVPWEQYPDVKEWYTRLKSRPSFRPLLEDKISGVVVSKHYRNLDF